MRELVAGLEAIEPDLTERTAHALENVWIISDGERFTPMDRMLTENGDKILGR